MQSVSIASPRVAWSGMLLGGAGAIAFSGKAIIVKLAARAVEVRRA